MVKIRDSRGEQWLVGDGVRILGVPDLSGIGARGQAECRRVFSYLVGKYKKIAEFDAEGNVGIWFRIRSGRDAGIHWIAIEPSLVRRRSTRAG